MGRAGISRSLFESSKRRQRRHEHAVDFDVVEAAAAELGTHPQLVPSLPTGSIREIDGVSAARTGHAHGSRATVERHQRPLFTRFYGPEPAGL